MNCLMVTNFIKEGIKKARYYPGSALFLCSSIKNAIDRLTNGALNHSTLPSELHSNKPLTL